MGLTFASYLKRNTMTTQTKSTNGKFYAKLLTHCQKQYKNVDKINKAYVENGQVYAIDFLRTDGVQSIASNTAIADSIIIFE